MASENTQYPGYTCLLCHIVTDDFRTHIRSEHLKIAITSAAPELSPEESKLLVGDLQEQLKKMEQFSAEYCSEIGRCKEIPWVELFNRFSSLLDVYKRILSATQHASPDTALCESLSYNIPSRLWHGYLQIFNNVAISKLPSSIDEYLCLLHHGYCAIIAQCDITPIFRPFWKMKLCDLALEIMRHGNESDTWRGPWNSH